MTVAREQLEAICGTGVANLRAWTSYTMPPNIARITARPQIPFTPQRLAIPRETAERWIVHDLVIGNRQQFLVEGGIRASEFSDEPLRLEVVQAGMDLRIEVEYIGDNPEGEMFRASIVGRGGEGNNTMHLPLASGRLIEAYGGRGVLLELEGVMHRFDERAGRLDRVRAYESTAEVIGDVLTQIENHGLLMPNIRPRDPVTVSLHVQTLNGGHVLFGIDERIGAVVFEVGNLNIGGSGTPYYLDPASPGALATTPPSTAGQVVQQVAVDELTPFRAHCDLGGYIPTWWSEAQAQRDDLHPLDL